MYLPLKGAWRLRRIRAAHARCRPAGWLSRERAGNAPSGWGVALLTGAMAEAISSGTRLAHADASHDRPVQRRAVDPGRARGDRDGVSAAQYVRDATILRTAYAMGQRGDADFEEAIARARARADPEGAAPPRAERAGAARRGRRRRGSKDRLEALHATGLLDSDISPSFDRLARLASHVLHAPVALVSLVDRDRQFFKSCLGLPEPWASERELAADALLLPARGRQPRAAAGDRRARAPGAARQPRDPRHGRHRLRRHPADRRATATRSGPSA